MKIQERFEAPNQVALNTQKSRDEQRKHDLVDTFHVTSKDGHDGEDQVAGKGKHIDTDGEPALSSADEGSGLDAPVAECVQALNEFILFLKGTDGRSTTQ